MAKARFKDRFKVDLVFVPINGLHNQGEKQSGKKEAKWDQRINKRVADASACGQSDSRASPARDVTRKPKRSLGCSGSCLV